MPHSLLSSDRVAEIREALGRDLRAEDGAAFRARMFSKQASAPASDTAAAVTSTAMPEPVTLPPVGRHTHALETLGDTRVRKPCLPDSPEFKKPKLEPRDENMVVEPGQPIDSQETEADVEIPTSPHFARPVSHIPHFDLTVEDGMSPVPTQKENDDDSDVCKVCDGDRDDELHRARTKPSGPLINNESARLIRNSSSAADPSVNPAGISKWAFGTAANNATETPNPGGVPPSGYAHFQGAPDIMPPWVQEIRDGFFGLHQKADAIHQEMSSFGAEVQAHGVRLSTLEKVADEHNSRQNKSEARIKALESKIEELLAQADKQELGSRSPTRTGLGTRGRSPSPRSPRNLSRSSRGGGRSDFFAEEADLDIVVGGWSDARKSDAIDEVHNIFRNIQFENSIEEVWAPYSRTGFTKVKLKFPDPEASVVVRRQFQTLIINKIKEKHFRSGVLGSEGAKIWATKSKTPEERAKIRAVVLTKEFYKTLSPGPGLAKFAEDQIEISWAGKVYIDRFQLLGSVERDGEPAPFDVCIEDSRGNHMNWYIKADVFSKVTSLEKEALQDLWLDKGPTSASARADA